MEIYSQIKIELTFKSFSARNTYRRRNVQTGKKSKKRDETDDDSDEDDEDQLVDDIVGFIKSNNLPAETIDNKSFQKILSRAGKRKKLKIKPDTMRELIQESLIEEDFGVDDGTKVNIKSEVDNDHGNVNEVWLNSLKSDDEYESESSYEPSPKRPSTSKSATKSNLRGKSEKFIDRKLTEMLISSSTPLELVDHPAFRSFIAAINPNYRLPNSYSIKSKLVEFIRKDF